MTRNDKDAIAYAMRRMRAKRAREAMMWGRIASVEDLRTGERARIVALRFPGREARLDTRPSV